MLAKGDLSLHQSYNTHFSLSTCSCSCTVSLPTPSVHPARHLGARSNRVQWNAIEADPSRHTLQHNRMTPTKRVFTQLNELQLGQICKFNSTSQSNQRVKTAELQRNTILPFESIGEREDSSIQGNDSPRTNTRQLEWTGAWDSSLFVDNRPATCHPHSFLVTKEVLVPNLHDLQLAQSRYLTQSGLFKAVITSHNPV